MLGAIPHHFTFMIWNSGLFAFSLQALSLIEQEKSSLAEKLSNTQRDLHNTELDLDRTRMEAATKGEQDKSR